MAVQIILEVGNHIEGTALSTDTLPTTSPTTGDALDPGSVMTVYPATDAGTNLPTVKMWANGVWRLLAQG